MTRLFVAIWPSPEAIASIAADVDRVRPRHPELRWQPADRWHVTCAFIGIADPDRTARTLDRLLADPPHADALRITGAGTFGPVVWLGVEHDPWLRGLARRIKKGLHTPDERFRAHVTVARGRGRDGRRHAVAAVPDLAGHAGPAWTPSEVTLVESVTGPSPRYAVLRRWSLGSAQG